MKNCSKLLFFFINTKKSVKSNIQIKKQCMILLNMLSSDQELGGFFSLLICLLHIIVTLSLGVQMEGDAPLGVEPGFLNQAQMYSQGQHIAVITSYLQLLHWLESIRRNSFSLQSFTVRTRGKEKPTWLDQASECRGNAETGNSCGWSGCWPYP